MFLVPSLECVECVVLTKQHRLSWDPRGSYDPMWFLTLQSRTWHDQPHIATTPFLGSMSLSRDGTMGLIHLFLNTSFLPKSFVPVFVLQYLFELLEDMIKILALRARTPRSNTTLEHHVRLSERISLLLDLTHFHYTSVEKLTIRLGCIECDCTIAGTHVYIVRFHTSHVVRIRGIQRVSQLLETQDELTSDRVLLGFLLLELPTLSRSSSGRRSSCTYL